MSEETPHIHIGRWNTTMAVKRIHTVAISAYCTLMLASAGIAADGVLMTGVHFLLPTSFMIEPPSSSLPSDPRVASILSTGRSFLADRHSFGPDSRRVSQPR